MSLLSEVAAHGPALLAGSTLVLGAGAVLVLVARAPLHRQRAAELTLAVAIAWLAAALVPLPRWSPLLSVRAGAPTDADLALVDNQRAAEIDGPRAGDGAVASGVDDAQAPGSPADPGALDERAAATLQLLARRPTPVDDDRETSGVARRTSLAASLPLPSGEPDAGLTLGPLLAAGLLTGSTLALLYLLAGLVRLRRVLASSEPAPLWLRDELARVSPLALPAGLDLRVARAAGPFCVGISRPVIVLPRALVDMASRTLLTPVLLHELAHARQRDGRGQLLAALALPAFWYHPLYWWLRRRLHLSAELVADDLAVAAAPMTRTEYARRLIDLAERTTVRRPPPLGATTVLGARSELTRRIEMLLQRHAPLAHRCSPARRGLLATYASALLVTASALWGATPAAAQDDLRAEVERLRAERADLVTQMASLRAALEALQGQAAAVRADGARQHDHLVEELAQIEAAQAAGDAQDLHELHERLSRPERQHEQHAEHAQHAHELQSLLKDMETAAAQDRLRADRYAQEAAALAAEADRYGQVAREHAAAGDKQAVEEALAALQDAARAAASLSPAEYRARQQAAIAAEADSRAALEALQAQVTRQQAAREELESLAGLGYLDASRDDGPASLPADRLGEDPLGGRAAGAQQVVLDEATLQLVTRALDLTAELQLAQLELEHLGPLAQSDFVSQQELTRAEIRLASLQRKQEIVGAILGAEIRATQLELEETERAMHEGRSPRSEARLVRLRARLDILGQAR